METQDTIPDIGSERPSSTRIPLPFALGGIGFVIAAIVNTRVTPTAGFLIGVAIGLALIIVGAQLSHLRTARGADATTETQVICPNCRHKLAVQLTKSKHPSEPHHHG